MNPTDVRQMNERSAQIAGALLARADGARFDSADVVERLRWDECLGALTAFGFVPVSVYRGSDTAA